MKKIIYNRTEEFLKELILFFCSLLLLLFSSTYLIANDFNHKVIIAEGRAVIIDNDLEVAKKRALDDALYLASLQAGARVDGYSNVDMNTNLNENLLVRPSSSIKDFTVIEESSDETHYRIKIKAYAITINQLKDCSKREFINLSYFQPAYSVSSKLPARTQKLPGVISKNIFEGLKRFENVRVKDNSRIKFNQKLFAKPVSLDYEALVEGKSNFLKSGEFGVHPIIEISSGKGRLNRFFDEMIVKIKLNIYEGSTFNLIDSMNYKFSLLLGNETGYDHIDAFFKVPFDKINSLVERSVSKLQFRILDQLQCYPLEAKVNLINDTLTIPLGYNQGLKTGKVGFISSNNPNMSMNDWVVLTVRQTENDFSVLELLNPLNKKESINGKLVRFLN